MTRAELEKENGQVWDTTELQQDFKVEGFSFGYCVVKSKKTDQTGTIAFQHSPRFYYGFVGVA